MLSLVAVFKDILPGYRIRLATDREQAMSLSKEVKQMRDFEAALLRHYQACLKGLVAAAQGSRGMAVARVAVKCLAELLKTRFTFNYASDLLQAICASRSLLCKSHLIFLFRLFLWFSPTNLESEPRLFRSLLQYRGRLCSHGNLDWSKLGLHISLNL